MEELRVLVPNGMLGYGFPLEDFERGIKRRPHGIVVDAGSTDSGPQKLALGEMTCPESAYYRELATMIPAAKEAGIPLIISSAGGDGTNEHVDLFVEMAEQIANEQELSLQVAKIYSDFPKDQINSSLQSDKITEMQNVPQLTQEEVEQATVVTAQMGAELLLALV